MIVRGDEWETEGLKNRRGRRIGGWLRNGEGLEEEEDGGKEERG